MPSREIAMCANPNALDCIRSQAECISMTNLLRTQIGLQWAGAGMTMNQLIIGVGIGRIGGVTAGVGRPRHRLVKCSDGMPWTGKAMGTSDSLSGGRAATRHLVVDSIKKLVV